MAKDNKKPAAQNQAPAKKGRDRKKRNAAERKCLPKSLKVLFAGSSREMFRALLKAVDAERHFRRYGNKVDKLSISKDEVSGLIV